MKIFIVNLDKDVVRREHILQQCRNLNLDAEVVSATDGRLLTAEETAALTHPLYASGMTPGEIGCSLSHYYIYKKIADENIPCALILEDDVELTAALPEVLAWYEASPGRRPEVVLLSETNKHHRRRSGVISKSHSVVKVTEAVFTHSYIINHRAAVSLAEFLFPIWLEADRWTLLREYGVIQLKAVVPPVGLHSELSTTSTIWFSEEEVSRRREVEANRAGVIRLIKKHRPFMVKLRNTLWRIFVRKFLSIEQARAQ
ncbi:glycosyltransferase family 25 protein [Pantoea dispersa]|uniref:glycosyltransferase family 25 protein n=1 Tax=Pantoea dispersa TaxID=59814 RepID=UPI0030169858